ncbi:MAG: hypothetical protein IJW58_04455 [Clostridia bacterium]|nr:hypothetical protein [Clostridia bacterium]
MKIAKEELSMEIEILLKDYFVAKVESQQNKTILKFLNGQIFFVTLEEA